MNEVVGDTSGALAVPAHVPPHLVRSYPFTFGATTTRNPFDDIVPEIHRGPEIFFVLGYSGDGSPAWIVRRAADLRAIYLDTEHFSNRDQTPYAKIAGEDWSPIPLETDPPMHRLYRAFVAPLFSAKAISAMDDKIRASATGYVAEIRKRGSCEFLSDFAFEFPIRVFLEFMGLPVNMIKQFRKWEADLIHAPDFQSLTDAVTGVVGYLREVIEDRKRRPVDDLISYGTVVEVDGRKLTDSELMGFCFNLFLGGLDTLSANMSLQAWHLARHPEHQKVLREDPSLIPAAIEEFMRAYAAVNHGRVCKKKIEFRGITFMPGDLIVMSTTLAGRDPEEYDRPNEVILDRNPKHVALGHGPHLCLGMHLARRQMRIAIEEMLTGLPEFHIAAGSEIRFHLNAVMQPQTLPLRWQSN